MDNRTLNIKELSTFITKLTPDSIVLTTGTFDILHVGHIRLFEEAKRKFKFLIVAVASDKVVKQYKGATRPINNINDRIYLLSSIKYIDFIFENPFYKTADLYNVIKFKNFIKGSEQHDCEKNALLNLGIKVYKVPKIENFSSTNIIKSLN